MPSPAHAALPTLFLALSCSCLTAPPSGRLDERVASNSAPVEAKPFAPAREQLVQALARVRSAAAAPSPTNSGTAAPANGAIPAPDQASDLHAAHILIAYKGALRAQAVTTRTKEEARKLAETLRNQATDAATFSKLAQEHSDDPGSRPKGGDLGHFQRGSMVKPFADAAFELAPGQVSQVVETQFGFHVIRRIE